MDTKTLVVCLAAALFPAAALPSGPEEEMLVHLLQVRRVYIEKLGGGEAAEHIRNMIIGSLHKAGLFVVTENQDRADATLRGSAEDLIFTDTFESSEGIDMRASAGLGSAAGARGSTGRRGAYVSSGVGDRESSRIAERKHEAAAAVRLVNREGDVIWSTTQESGGGKFRGAGADVADKITRQLVADLERAKKLRAASPQDANTLPR